MAAAAAGGPTRAPANIEDFLWNTHSVLAAQPGPLPIEALKDAYSKHFGHKCAIERFLVIGEGGLSATLKRIPHIVRLCSENGTTLVRARQEPNISKQQLIEADACYRRELIKKNAKAKAGAAGKQPAAAASTKVGAAMPSAAGPAAAAKANSRAETLARTLGQGVVRMLQKRQKAGKGPLPVEELGEEFKALWKVPFNLQQAGESDTATFLQKWANKVEICTSSDGAQVVQLAKKAAEKPEAAAAAPAEAAEAAAPPTPAAAKAGAGATATSTAVKAPSQVAAENGMAVPERAGGPMRRPASIEDFLWNQALVAAGAAALATTVPAAPAAPAAMAAKAGGGGSALPQKQAGEGGGEQEAKKPRNEGTQTLTRMLVQGVVRVLQNRQRKGHGPLPIANLEEEFKALWEVPFSLQLAGECDPVSFLRRWPNKVGIVTDDKGQPAIQPAAALAVKATSARSESTPVAVVPTETVAEAECGDAEALRTLPDMQREASSVLAALREMVRRQEQLVSGLQQLSSGEAAV